MALMLKTIKPFKWYPFRSEEAVAGRVSLPRFISGSFHLIGRPDHINYGLAEKLLPYRQTAPRTSTQEASRGSPWVPPSSEYGTYTTVNAVFWPWLQDKSPQPLSTCSLFARKRVRERALLTTYWVHWIIVMSEVERPCSMEV